MKMGKICGLWIVLICCFLPATFVFAQSSDEIAAIKAFEAELKYQQGKIVLPGNLATLDVPKHFRYLGPDHAHKVLVDAWGNPPELKTLGMLVPAGTSPLSKDGWGVIITYDEDGYVKDDEADSLDYKALLKQMQESIEESNQTRGNNRVQLIGWATPPRYEKASHKLYWAKELQFADSKERTLNYNIRVLGRKGVLVLNAVSTMDQLSMIERNMKDVVGFVDFNPGQRYADFQPGVDRIAAYGIGALIAGKLLAKAGLFKVLIGMLIAFKKLILAAVIGVVYFVRKLFYGTGEAEARVDD